MSSCKDKKNNSKNPDGSYVRTDRMYHDCETFLYRYRWWIVLILAILLAYYLYTRKCETGETSSTTTVTTATTPAPVVTDVTGPKLGGALNYTEPHTSLNTEGRSLFKL
jgi:hypothetical protein